jgi:hypothetical protein
MPSSILNSDDGVISGTSGLKSSGGDDGVLVFQSKGTETARINTDKQIVAAAGTASLPALTTTGDLNTGIFFPAADTIAFAEGGAEAMRIDSNGKILVGSTSSLTGSSNISIEVAKTNSGSVGGIIAIENTASSASGNTTQILFKNSSSFGDGFNSAVIESVQGSSTNCDLRLSTYNSSAGSVERMRIDSSGRVLVGTSNTNLCPNNQFGISFGANFNDTAYAGVIQASSNGNAALGINRGSDDGTLVNFYQAGTVEGSISVSGSTVSYNGGHLSRWAQMLTKPDLLKGTVMSNLDEMNVYIKPTLYWTEDDELPVDDEGNPTVAVGDLKQETSVSDNEQLNKVKVSDVEGDANVAGVFVNWDYDEAHQVDEINMAMTGDMIIRIAQGVTVARGDLLMSAGDGTAKPQGDDIVRSKTIAKVTSTHVTCTYDDGSYCVPCVLMAC